MNSACKYRLLLLKSTTQAHWPHDGSPTLVSSVDERDLLEDVCSLTPEPFQSDTSYALFLSLCTRHLPPQISFFPEVESCGGCRVGRACHLYGSWLHIAGRILLLPQRGHTLPGWHPVSFLWVRGQHGLQNKSQGGQGYTEILTETLPWHDHPFPPNTHLTQEWEKALGLICTCCRPGYIPICMKVRAPRESSTWATVQGAVTWLVMSTLS